MALSNYSSPVAGQTSNPKPGGSELPQHAEHLNHLALVLNEQNNRLTSLLGKIFGPSPDERPAAEPEANGGVLHVAQFAARRISIEVERLQVLASRLENLA